jgi:hypothetical protein
MLPVLGPLNLAQLRKELEQRLGHSMRLPKKQVRPPKTQVRPPKKQVRLRLTAVVSQTTHCLVFRLEEQQRRRSLLDHPV